MAEKAVKMQKQERKMKKSEAQYRTRRPIEQDNEIELGEFVPSTQLDHDYSKVADGVPCVFCDKIFNTANQMMTHRSTIHRGWRRCLDCRVPFETTNEYDVHIANGCSGTSRPKPTVAKTSNFEINCSICRQSFGSTTQIRHHQEAVHGLVVKVRWACPVCKTQFLNLKKLKAHCSKAHATQKALWLRKLVPKYCRRVTKTMNTSSTIVKPNVAPTIVTPQTSPVKELKRPLSADVPTSPGKQIIDILQSSLAMDEEPGQSGVICRYCDEKGITIGSNLCKINMMDDWRCHVCGHQLKNKQGHIVHFRSHFRLRIVCHICQETFPSKLHYYEHDKAQHSGSDAIVEPKKQQKPKPEKIATKIPPSPKSENTTNFTCLCCRQLFATDVALNNHYAQYAKRKFHQCRFCSERLGSANDLESHEEEHKNNSFTPYQCHICSKKLRSMPTLLAHRKEKHSDWQIVDFYMPEISQRLAMKQFDDESVEGSVDATDENQSDAMRKARKSLCPETRTKIGVEEKEIVVKEECHYCWESFPNKQALSAHVPIHRLENEPFRCPECMQTFAWKNDRHRHRFLYHGVPMPENHPSIAAAAKYKKVKETAETTTDNAEIEEERENRGSFQLLRQLGEKSWQCCTCKKFYKNRVSGNVHATKCRKNAQTRMHRQKSILHKKQQQQNLLDGDIIETSETDTVVKKEEIEDEDDEDKRIVKNLLNRDLTNLKTRFEVKPIQCACCLRVFKNNFSLSRHINYMVAHWCKVCGGLYKKLAMHQETKHGYQYKAIMCLQCGSVFETQSGLNEHIIDEHAKSRDVDSIQLKTVDEIKQEVVEETRIYKHVVQCDEDSKSSAGETISDSEKIGRSLHDVLDPKETHNYFSKKVVHGSNFLLSKSDPDSRLMERPVARNSFKNQCRKRKSPKPGTDKVVGRRTGRKTPATGSTEVSDEEGTIDSLSDDDCSTGDQSTVVAAVEEQYSRAVSQYEKKDKTKEKNSAKKSKERAGLFEAMDKKKVKSSPEKRDKRLLRADVPKKVKSRMKFDESLFDSESDDFETKPPKKIKKDKHRPKPDLIPIEIEGSVAKKFKIPRKSPKKRSSSIDEEIPSKKAKSSHHKTEEPRMDKLKSKIDAKTLSVWKSFGSVTPQEEPVKKKPVAKKSLKSPPPAVSEPSTITLTLNESGELVSQANLGQSGSDTSLPRPIKAKARKTIHGVRPQPSEKRDELKRSTSYSECRNESRKDDERFFSRQTSTDKDSRNDDSSAGSRTPSEGGRTPNDTWSLDTVPKKESQKARKSSHGTQEGLRREERRRADEPDRYDDRWRHRDDRSSTSSERRLERSDSRGSDKPHSSREEYRPPLLPTPHKAILIDAVPDTKPDREEERRRSIEVLKRQFERRPMETCKICSENFSNKTLLFRHVNDVHRSGQRRANEERPRRFEYDPSHDGKERDFRRFDNELLKCMYCPMTFPDRVSRSQHIGREHNDTPRDVRHEDPRRPMDDRPVRPVDDTPQFPCTECWKQFVSQRGLELHMINKHGAEPGEDMSYHSSNPYDYKPPSSDVERRPRARMGSSFVRPRCECEVCGRTFPDRHALNIHMRGHSTRPETPDPREISGPPEPGAVTCKICLNHFHSFTALRQHHAQVHDGRDEVDFECRLCGKVFPSFGALNAHKAVHRSRMM